MNQTQPYSPRGDLEISQVSMNQTNDSYSTYIKYHMINIQIEHTSIYFKIQLS